MEPVNYILRQRRNRRERSKKDPKRHLGFGCSLALSLLVAALGIFAAWGYAQIFRDLPHPGLLPALLDAPDGSLLEPTRLYDRSGEHIILTLDNPAIEQRTALSLDPSQSNYLPTTLISATLATLDPTFWRHPGYSLSGLRRGEQTTLAQRLVSDLLLWQEPPSLARALRERLLAAQITARFGRERILEWYLNSANYGRLAFGAEAAARVYFGKPAAQLSLAEAALLAAVNQAPALNPHDAPQAAVEGQKEVITIMENQGLITTDQAHRALVEELKFRPPVKLGHNPAPAFANLILEQLSKRMDVSRLERGGFEVITTLDYDLQSQALCASDAFLNKLSRAQAPATFLAERTCPAALLLPTISGSHTKKTGDMVANIIVYDPQQGQILALVGQPSPGSDPVKPPGHPPGTLLTPFIYLTAFTRGMAPATLLWDLPNPQISFQNSEQTYHGPVRLRIALANDYLIPAAQVLNQIGSETVRETLRQLGFREDNLLEMGELPLEQGEITLLEAARAYGILANSGVLVGMPEADTNHRNGATKLLPLTYLRVENRHDEAWFDLEDAAESTLSRPVLSRQLAYLITDILSDETARWPSMGHPNPLEIGHPVAAKLGSTANNKHSWALGYTPDLLVGVWLGVANENPTGEVAPTLAATLWNAIMRYAVRDLSPAGWAAPPGINQLEVCDPSGMLPSADCPNIVNEVFLDGTEPTHVDTLYRSFQINRETGRLATAFTPPELIEERIFLMLPPESIDWARSIGLPAPPSEYDIIAQPAETSPHAQISKPALYAYVRGLVEIRGRAAGDDFEFYRLQVGQGLNPQTWIQLGQDTSRPVPEDSILGEWDTTGLNGLYTLQLLVVFKDQRVASDIIQVTVDNQPPEVLIIHPQPGQEYSTGQNTMTFQVSASDDLALSDVQFYLDGKLIGSFQQEPYLLQRDVQAGDHSFRVVVSDQAGNRNFDRLEFSLRE